MSRVRHLAWLAVLLAGTAMSVVVYVWLDRAEHARLTAEIAHRSETKLVNVRVLIRQHLDATNGILAFVDGAMMLGRFDTPEALANLRGLLRTHPRELVAAAILPPAEYGPGVRVGPDGKTLEALDPPFGGVLPARLSAGERRLALTRDAAGHPRLRVYLASRERPQALAVVDLDIVHLLKTGVTETGPAGLDVAVDAVVDGNQRPLLRHVSRQRTATPGTGERDRALDWRDDFEAGGLRFVVRTRPAPALIERFLTRQPTLALALGLLASYLAAFLTYNRLRFGERLRQQVAQRTAALADEQSKLASVIDHAQEGVLLADDQGGILRSNPAAGALFGYAPEEWPRLNVQDLIPDPLRPQHLRWMKEMAEDGAHCIMGRTREVRGRRKDGSIFPCEVTVDRFDDQGRDCLSIILRDITLRRQQEWTRETLLDLRAIGEQARPLEQRLQRMLDRLFQDAGDLPHRAAALFLVADQQLHMVASHGLGQHARERCAVVPVGECVCGQAVAKGEPLCVPHRPKGHRLSQREAGDRGYLCLPVMHGEERLAAISLTLDPGAAVPDVFRTFCEQLEEIVAGMLLRERDATRLEHLSLHDELTGLPNRRLFGDRLQQSIAVARRGEHPCALLYIDLDRFKFINDSMGHGYGDRVLAAMGERLRLLLRESDTTARLGGDEFAVLLPEADEQTALAVAHKLRETITRPCLIGEHEFLLDASIGIALFPRDGSDPETLLKHADAAMYHAKEGRSHVHCFTSNLAAAVERRLRLEQELARAVDERALQRFRHGAELPTPFPLHYQAKYALQGEPRDGRAGALLGVEALVRWNHPELGMVPPAEFIPLAEETGLIRPLTRWVLAEAARQAIAWERAGTRPPRIGINISPVKLMRGGLAADLLTQIDELGAQPDWFEVEITETAAMRDPETAIASMRELVDAGLSVAIDDFGTGYSSLAYLRQFPVDWLKIDIAFVRGLPHSEGDAAIVRSIIAMAHNLGIRVVAEGIETEAQLEFLRQAGCDAAQGYLVGRPVPADAMGHGIEKGDGGI